MLFSSRELYLQSHQHRTGPEQNLSIWLLRAPLFWVKKGALTPNVVTGIGLAQKKKKNVRAQVQQPKEFKTQTKIKMGNLRSKKGESQIYKSQNLKIKTCLLSASIRHSPFTLYGLPQKSDLSPSLPSQLLSLSRLSLSCLCL